MGKELRFHPLVAADLSNAISHYDGIAVNLGNRFRAAVKERIKSVRERPESFGKVHGELRAARLNLFPFVIVFEHDRRLTQILGIFHAAADRGKWIERSG